MTRGILSVAVLLVAGVFLLTVAAPPNPAGPPDDVAEAIRQLDDAKFAVRKKAADRLLARGTAAIPHLRNALPGAASAESRVQIERLLAQLTRLPWHTDPAEALAAAKASGKPILTFSTIGEPNGFA